MESVDWFCIGTEAFGPKGKLVPRALRNHFMVKSSGRNKGDTTFWVLLEPLLAQITCSCLSQLFLQSWPPCGFSDRAVLFRNSQKLPVGNMHEVLNLEGGESWLIEEMFQGI